MSINYETVCTKVQGVTYSHFSYRLDVKPKFLNIHLYDSEDAVFERMWWFDIA